MRAFGSLRIAATVAILFLSLAECKPNKRREESYAAGDYADDAEYDEESATGGADSDLNITPPPLRLRSQNTTFVRTVGDTVELPCLVDNAEDTVISWLKGAELIYIDDKPMTDYSRRFIRAQNFSLIIPGVTEKDASDQYRCQILDSPPIEVVYKLVVLDKPRELSKGIIRVEPTRVINATEKDNLKFGCVVEIEPKPRMRWTHNGERPHNVVTDEDGSHIIINKVTRHHAGKYQCLVIDPISTDKDATPPHEEIQLVVRYTPVIDIDHEIVHTGTGIDSQLTCIVHAHPRANVAWYLYNEKTNTRKMITEKQEKTHFIVDKTHHTLVIKNTTVDDLGEYICVARNKIGERSRNIELTGAPFRPKFHNFELTEDESMVNVEWHVESYSPIIEYQLEYRPKGEAKWTKLSPTVQNGKGNQFYVKHLLGGLQPGAYEARLSAKNERGWSMPSKIETFRNDNKPAKAENVTDPNGSPVTSRPLLAMITLLLITVPFYESTYL